MTVPTGHDREYREQVFLGRWGQLNQTLMGLKKYEGARSA